MHRALIVSSKYDPATGYPDREAWRVSNKRLGLRLQQHGYAVEWLEPGAGLVRKLREALATEDPLSAVVIVFSGYILLTESGEPAVLLSDEHVIALRLEQLCSKAGRTFGRVLCVVDGVRGSSTRVVHEANPQATEASAETLLARMAVRTVRGDNVGMLVRVSPWGASNSHSDFGLCEQLCRILENLDEAQALSTPELELDLLDSDEGGATLCRHSKPAFVFLPARRFASEPPKPPRTNEADGSRLSEPRIDNSVEPHTSRDDDGDRDAWTPPPDDAEATTLVSGEENEPTRVPPTPPTSSENTAAHSTSHHGDERVTGASLPPLPPLALPPLSVPPLSSPALSSPPLAGSGVGVSSFAAPPLGAAAVVEETSGSPRSPASEALGPALTSRTAFTSAPPLPLTGALPLPPLDVPPLVVAVPSAVATAGLASETERAVTQVRPSPSHTLGSPPPLPFEREPLATSAGLAALPVPSAPAQRPLGTPPPLPSERGAASFVPPPLPVERDALSSIAPPLPNAVHVAPVRVSHPDVNTSSREASPTTEHPIPETNRELGVPPPLPAEREGVGALAADLPLPATNTDTDASIASEPANASFAELPPRDGETEPAAGLPAPTSERNAAPATNEPDAVEPDAVDAAPRPDSSEPSDARSSQAPSRPSPPPRRHRDSAAPPAPAGAPSIAPPVLSPESWRPQPDMDRVARDEAGLLALAQAAISAGDDATGLSHAEQCLTSFPESAQALQLAASVLVARGDFQALASRYADLVSRQSKPESAAQLCAAASRLWATQLHDPGNARMWLERGLELDATNASLQRELADLLDQAGEHEQALGHSLLALRGNPMSPVTAAATFQRLGETQSRELTFTVACILSFLGHTTNRVVDLVASQRAGALPKPIRCLTEEDYTFGLDVAATDPELTRLLALLEPFARQLELPKPRQQRALVESLRAEDVERSTTMLARTFGWTCRLLTLGTPNLFLTETDTLPHLLPVEPRSFAVGKSLGRGLSLPELTFLWGRALAWSRPQTRILYSLPSTVRLLQFLRACRAAAGVDETPSSETKALAKLLKKDVPNATWATVTASLAALGSAPEERVEHWKHAADQVANRLGLLACGDPELAARTLDRFPTVDGGSRKKQLSELLSFALSDDYQELRRRLGLHLG